MEILGIGPSELIFIIIIALIILGPKDMQKAGKSIGRWLNQLVKSDSWMIFQQTSRELRNLPTNLMREANMELKETEKDIQRSIDPRIKPSASSSSPSLPPSEIADSSIQPLTLNTPPNPPAAEDGEVSKTDQHE